MGQGLRSRKQRYSGLPLDGSGWTVVANDKTAGLESLGTVSGNSYSVPARSAAVLVQSSTFSNLQVEDTQFGTLTINHKDEDGNLLKTSTAKYREGSTYRAIPDSTILFDHTLVGTDGTTSGTVTGGQNYTVTYTYSSTGIESGYLTVKYVDGNGTAVKDEVSYHLRAGDTYEIPYATIQGYQLDTDNYPANTYGTFTGSDQTITVKCTVLEGTTTTVHYYNSNNWSTIRCYAYTDGGAEPNGAWASATKMTSEGNNWYVCTIPASSAYIMFHNGGSSQEPGQGESGYRASGEVWIENKVITFGSKVITSHIDLVTGEKITEDVIEQLAKTTSAESYTTTAIFGAEDVIVPGNAQGNYSAGVINVVYLYTSEVQPTQPDTTEIVETTTEETQPAKQILIGDTDLNGAITISDATTIQKYCVDQISFNEDQMIAGECDGDGVVGIKDATLIQKYLVDWDDMGMIGEYVDIEEPTTEPVTEPTTEAPTTTQPVTEATTVQPTTTEPVTEPTPDTYTVYFTNSLNWTGTIYCYCWEEGANGEVSWPGAAMTYVETNDYGQKIYSAEVPSYVNYLIFNNNNSQTVNIPFDGTDLRYYATSEIDSSWHNYYGTW